MRLIFLLFTSVLAKLYLPLHTTEKYLRSGKDLSSAVISSYNNVALYQISYTVQVSIGTPGQLFNLLLDISFSNLWIVDDICKSCIKPSHVFVPTESSTLATKVELIHLDPQYSDAEALLCTDIVELSGLTAESQTFALVVADLTYEAEAWDGVLGLGFNSTYGNLVQTLYNQSQIEAPMFSLYFSKDEDAESKLILGGVDYDYIEKNSLKLIGVTRGQNNWVTNLENIILADETISVGTMAVFDLSTPFVLAPYNDLYRIYDVFKRKYDCQDGPQVTCNCENMKLYPNITFLLGVSSVLLPPEGYLHYNSSSGECVLLFEESETDNWVVGASFLRQFYSVFSLPSNGNSAFIGLGVPKAYHSSNGGDSTDDLLGLKIGLPIGGVIALGAVGVVCCWCVLKRRKVKKEKKNQQKLIVYVAPDPSAERIPEEPRLTENADVAHREVRPIMVVNDQDQNVQTVFYPFLPPVADS